MDEDTFQKAAKTAADILDNVEKVIRGKREKLLFVLAAIAARGHVLLEDVPGLGKTATARAFAQSMSGTFKRIQCTPDLQPTDITGLQILNPVTREFEFRPGPVFANVVLADEINRAMPKTQSALLEAMGERQVTTDDTTRVLEEPFIVLATQNPIESEGTFPLPEAQLDRFLMKLSFGYPAIDEEFLVLKDQQRGHPLGTLGDVVSAEKIVALQEAVEDVFIHELLMRWIVEVVDATRTNREKIRNGASVRASLGLQKAARAIALLCGRAFVIPEDIKKLFVPVVGHRLIFTFEAEAEMRETSYEEALETFFRELLEQHPLLSESDWTHA